MRPPSSEAKDWKSRVVTEAEEVLCRESAQAARQATEAQEAMDQYKAKWRQAEADLEALCQSNSAHLQSLAANLQETSMEHHELYTAQERQLRLKAQALREAQVQEQQAAQMTQEHEYAIQEPRRQAEEQPAIQKTLWKRPLSQQSIYKAETHELFTEMLPETHPHTCHAVNPTRHSWHLEAMQTNCMTCCTMGAHNPPPPRICVK